MRYSLILFYLLCSVTPVFSQSETVTNAVALIGAQKWDEAHRFLDSILKTNGKDIDAQMMKGNIILNKYLIENNPKPIFFKLEESILTDGAPHLTDPPAIVLQKQADSVSTIWQSALSQAPDRADIHMGLCTLYGMSLQTDKLLKQLPLLKRASKQGDNTALYMEDYARLLRDRNRIEDAQKVFAVISLLYPNLSAVKSDWAGELLLVDELSKAKIKALEVLKESKHFDSNTRENLTDIFLFSGDVLNALVTQKRYAQIDTSYKYAKLYESLVLFGGNDEIWKDVMSMNLKTTDFESDTQEVVQLSRFLASPLFKNDYEGYMAILSVPLSNFSSWIVLNRAANLFPDSLYFQLMLGEFYLSGKNASMANSRFEKVMKMTLDSALNKDVSLMYAYSLYQSNNYKEASKLFQTLLSDENVFRRQASAYFFGKMNKRKDLLESLSKEKEKSKYVYLAKFLLPTL